MHFYRRDFCKNIIILSMTIVIEYYLINSISLYAYIIKQTFLELVY